MNVKTFALVDCNNFYASCEQIFRPDLRGKPLVVLSNNDGCVVARSAEAKALGIKMGVPAHQIKNEIRQHKIQVFSSNYALYADISSRVMQLLGEEAPAIEVYSIDEAFLDLTGIDSCTSFNDFGLHLRTKILQQTGITICVGIAPTKTLAKLANWAAKQYPATGGVVDLSCPARQKRLLKLVPVEEIWGIGRRTAPKLEALGIHTALNLATSNASSLGRQFSVVLERTARELQGISCLELEEVPPTKKQIVTSRSFGEKITGFDAMREAVSSYTAKAASKLRKEKQLCQHLTIFIETSRYNSQEATYADSISLMLALPTNNTQKLLQASLGLLQRIWKDGYRYAKAGVMLSDFYSQETQQQDLFLPVQEKASAKKLTKVLDQLNKHKQQVFFAAEGTGKAWAMNRKHLSPAYTTNWQQLPEVN